MAGATAPMTTWGHGWRTGVVAWVVLSLAATTALTVGAWWWWAVTAPSSPAATDPGLVEGAVVAPVGAAWLVALSQVVIVPVAAAVGAAGALRVRRRRR